MTQLIVRCEQSRGHSLPNQFLRGIGNPVTQIDERSKHCWLLEEAEQSTEAAYLGYVNVTRSPGMRWPLADSQALPSFAAQAAFHRDVFPPPLLLQGMPSSFSTRLKHTDVLSRSSARFVRSTCVFKILAPNPPSNTEHRISVTSPISTLAERLLRGVGYSSSPLGCRRK